MSQNELLERLGADIAPELLELALTHSSFAYENNCESNERLEFLGDSILGFLVAAHVFADQVELNEGELTKLKNAVVSANALATAANRIGLGQHIRLGKGERQTGGAQKLNVLADAFEAVLGAAFLTSGISAPERIVRKHILPLLENPDSVRESADPKTSLIELASQKGLGDVHYEISSEGPDHERRFTAVCFAGDRELARAVGTTKRGAETLAAISALRELNNS